MKRAICLILMAIFTSNPTQAEAFLDIFSSGNKHDRSISEIVLKSLDSPDVKWIWIKPPKNEKYKNTNVYVPEKEIQNEERVMLRLVEFHLSKHPRMHTINDLFLEDKKLFNKESKPVVKNQTDYFANLEKAFNKVEIVFQNENSICYEVQCLLSSQKVKIEPEETKISGDYFIFASMIPDGPETILPVIYVLNWIVDIGGGEFRKYSYALKEYKPSEEEKNNLIELFKYMEERIKSVPS